MGPEIPVTSQDAELYLTRLIKSCELRQSLDSGNYPLTHYSSGEEKAAQVRVRPDGIKEIVPTEIVQLPIWKPQKGREKGLRYGVLFSIYSDFNMLCEMGLQKEATEIVVFDRSMPGGKRK
jgi:hypothetical protein